MKTWLSASPPHHSPSRSTSVIFSFHDVMKNDKYTSFHDEWFHFGFSFHIKSTWQANWKQVRELITNASRSHHVFDILREHLHIVLCSFPPSARRTCNILWCDEKLCRDKGKAERARRFLCLCGGKGKHVFPRSEIKFQSQTRENKIKNFLEHFSRSWFRAKCL